MERYIVKYLVNSTQDEWRRRYLDYMRMLFDQKMWSYGDNMDYDLENIIEKKSYYIISRENTSHEIWKWIKRRIKKKFHIPPKTKYIPYTAPNIMDSSQYKYQVLSTFHMPWLSEESLKELNLIGIKVLFFYEIDNFQCFNKLRQWYNNAIATPFNILLTDQYTQELKEIYDNLLLELTNNHFDGLLVHTAELFENKILIDVFRELGKPSIEIIHGFPGITSLVQNKVDYMLVYGESLRKNLITFGYNKDKVIVAGNSKYTLFDTLKFQKLRCSMDDVLVLTSATAVRNQHYWKYDEFPINDRSLLITYLYSVESVLKKNGVSHERLRPHPMVNKQWLSLFVDMDFYEMDTSELSQSFNRATCCIGQSSTIVFEAISHGVSYIVYEPGDGKHSLTNATLPPPFDGSDEKMKTANTEEQLDIMIKSKYCPDVQIINEYMETFKPQVLLDILSKERNTK